MTSDKNRIAHALLFDFHRTLAIYIDSEHFVSLCLTDIVMHAAKHLAV